MIRGALDWTCFVATCARDAVCWALIGATILLGGCAFVGKDGVSRSFGVYPIAAPEPQTVTIDKALTVAGDISVLGYGRLFFGFSSGLRARIPVICIADGRCFVPKLSTDTKAATSFAGGTTVADGITLDGFTEIPAAVLPALRLNLGLDTAVPPVPAMP